MIRLSTILWLALVACAGFGMFEVKYQVMQIEDELGRLNRAIGENHQAIHVLDAEWSFLTQPSRLDQLAHRHLTLGPIAKEQLGQVAVLPMRTPGSVLPDASGQPSVSPASASPAGASPGSPAGPAGARLATAKLRIER